MRFSVLLLLLLAGSVQAETYMYKCKDAKGKMIYSDKPCVYEANASHVARASGGNPTFKNVDEVTYRAKDTEKVLKEGNKPNYMYKEQRVIRVRKVRRYDVDPY